MNRLLILTAVLLSAGLAQAQTVLHSERSLYRNILVTEDDGKRCLTFSLRDTTSQQSCKLMDNPRRLVFPYARMMFAGLLVNAAPQRILMVGLGGGSIPATLRELFPAAVIDVVEIDAAVVKVAERFFGFHGDANMHVHVADARVFIKRRLQRNEQYDLILLDAFTGEYIPEHLLTLEFLGETKAALTENGVLVANTFAISKLYDHESTTYRRAFGSFFNLRTTRSLNRIIVATKVPLPPREQLNIAARQWSERLDAYDIEISEYPANMSLRSDWKEDARILTDDYSPANLLRGERR